ncbi:MAG: YraN family protein [Oscillospiraceae bacterium]|nr:YraN family protein [Oscillospiraceae bacterium]
MAMPENLKTGLRGEQLVARELIKRGYEIVSANYRTRLGETDIIAQTKEGVLCFVEVKTRAPGGEFPPSDAVDREKRARLINNAAAFIKYTKIEYSRVRFDIAEVILYDLFTADINIIEDAFGQGALPDGTFKGKNFLSELKNKFF